MDPNLVYQKWLDQIFPSVNFVFSHYGHFGLGGGGQGVLGEGSPPPWVLIILKKPCSAPYHFVTPLHTSSHPCYSAAPAGHKAQGSTHLRWGLEESDSLREATVKGRLALRQARPGLLLRMPGFGSGMR